MKKILVPLLALMLVSGLVYSCAPPVNRAPVLDPIGDKVVNEGQPLSFTISATDPDGDPLTYSASNLPAGATFDSGTRTFFWIPDYDQAGTYPVTFTVSDGSLTDSEAITIAVTNTNRSPVLDAIGDKTVNEGQPLSFTISATDPDGDPLAYSASNLPTGANFTPATRTFSWIPDYDQAGTYPVTFTVSDGSLTDSETITITVNNINRPPILDAIGDKTVNEGQPLSFTISATDPDGDPLAYSASNLPTGANFTPATRTFSWIPDYDQAGTYEDVHFEVTDGELIDYEEITITVVNLTLNATVDMDADTINLGAPRKWLTAYIELPTEYQPESVNLFTVRLNLNGAPAIPAVTDPKYDFVTDPAVYIQDHDGDGIPERMVKFDWSLVKPLLELGDNVLLVTGRLIDWPVMPDFEGTDTVKVIE